MLSHVSTGTAGGISSLSGLLLAFLFFCSFMGREETIIIPRLLKFKFPFIDQ